MDINVRLLATIVASLSFMLLSSFVSAAATTYTVSVQGDAASTTGGNGSGTSGDLRYTINQSNAGGVSGNTIEFANDITAITLEADLPAITNSVTITSNNSGQAISGNSLYLIFATSKASLSLTNLLLSDGVAQGGIGVGGGGGGMGAGGGIYIDVGQELSLYSTTISGCAAIGGNGSVYVKSDVGSGNTGGYASFYTGATVGADAGYGGGNGGSGVGDSDDDGSGGIGSSAPGAGGAGGDAAPSFIGGDGGAGGYCGGGGGGGIGNASNKGSGGGGGGGSSGGAGGGGDQLGDGGPGGGFGAGGNLTYNIDFYGGGGGGGGFGGGGGAAGYYGSPGGGGGGFGGGGGTPGGTGGAYGGSATPNTGAAPGTYSGGGAGIGGAIFVSDSASLQIGKAVNIVTGTNNVTGGDAGGSTATAGVSLAPDIFLFKGASLTFTTGADFAANFAIQGDPAAPTIIPGTSVSGIDAGVTVDVGSGNTISLTNNGNTYQGGTVIISGTLSAGSTNLPSTGAISIGTEGTLALTSAYAPGVAVTNAGAINISGGAFTIPTSFTNTGGLYVVNSGSISGDLTGGTSLSIGQNSTSTSNPNNFTTDGTISSIPIIHIYANSQFTVAYGDGVSGVTSNFTVDSTATATFNDALTGNGGVFLNNGTTAVGATGSINTTGTFTNNNIVTIASGGSIATGAFTNSSTGSVTTSATFAPAANSINAGTITINADGSLAIPASFSGTGGTITTSGTGTLTVANPLNADNGIVANGGITNISAAFAPDTGSSNAGIMNLTTNAIFAVPATFTDSGTINVDGSAPQITTNSLSGSGAAVLNIGSMTSGTTFSNGVAISNIPTITVQNSSQFTVSNAITGVNTAFSNSAGSTTTLNAEMSGTAAIGTTSNSNSGTLNINSTFALAGYTNKSSGLINLAGANNSPLTNNGTLLVNGVASNSVAIANNNILTLSSTLSNTGSIANAVSGTLTFGAGTNTTNSIINNGTFNVSGTSTADGSMTNNKTMYINAALDGTGIITNASGGTLELAVNAMVSNTINNQAGGIINVTGAGSGPINNAGTLNVLQPLDATGDLNNTTGLVNMKNAINMPGFTFTNSGTTTVTGNQMLTAASFINNGTLNFTITNETTYDSIIATGCPITLNDGNTVNISSSFIGAIGQSVSWPVLIGSSITSNGITHVKPPVTLGTWSHSIVGGNILQIDYFRSAADVFTPLPGVDTEIAQVLAEMSNNITNSGQQELVDVVDSATSQGQYDYILNNLQPDTNSSNVNLAMQSAGFNKLEVRVAQVQRNKNRSNKKNHHATNGIATGDITPNMSMWAAGLGSISKQQNNGDNQGYRARTLGGMVGFDMRNYRDDIYGIAFGVSNANVYALFNTTNKLRVLGYNLMLYGANHIANDWFAEWLVSGVINKNDGIRVFGINGTNLSTQASYRGAIAGARFNIGQKVFLNDVFDLTQIYTLQYVLVHQPSYNETGSVAALHVSTRNNSSILTVGTGFRLGILNDMPWLNGNRELHAIFTYDAMTPQQATTANFIVGSNTFNMISSPERFAVRLGADCAFTLYKNLNLQFSYNYEFRSGYYNNFGDIKLRYVF